MANTAHRSPPASGDAHADKLAVFRCLRRKTCFAVATKLEKKTSTKSHKSRMRRATLAVGAAAAAAALALVALTVSSQLRTNALAQKLFDVDGPSPRDPPRSAWDKGGKGTSAWMENKKPVQVLSQKAHSRGRRDRFFDAMIRHAPREVSQVLDIPMAKVQIIEHKVAKKMVREFKAERKARAMHAVHRGMLKGMGSMMLADAVNVTDMSVCEGKFKGCDALAENILEVAKSISTNCATLYFNEKEYYKCEAELAEPVCKQVDRDFPQMCGPDGLGNAGRTGYSVEHGYIGSESPANIHGELEWLCSARRQWRCTRDASGGRWRKQHPAGGRLCGAVAEPRR